MVFRSSMTSSSASPMAFVRAFALELWESVNQSTAVTSVWRGLARITEASSNGSNSETLGAMGKTLRYSQHRRRIGSTWYATANTDPGHLDSREGRQHELLQMFARWHEPVESLIAGTEAGAIMKNGAYDLPPLKRWGHGRVMLLGDAVSSLHAESRTGGLHGA